MRNNPFTGQTKTKASFGESVNINKIAARVFQGQPIPMRDGVAMYGDFSNGTDLQAALEMVDNARNAFMAIPAKVRGTFDNDPVKYVDFMEAVAKSEPDARDQAIDLGLVVATPAEATERHEREVAKAKAKLDSLEPPDPPPEDNKPLLE